MTGGRQPEIKIMLNDKGVEYKEIEQTVQVRVSDTS
jgi:hypothetical protein